MTDLFDIDRKPGRRVSSYVRPKNWSRNKFNDLAGVNEFEPLNQRHNDLPVSYQGFSAFEIRKGIETCIRA